MAMQWILVANSSIARLFGRISHHEHLVALASIHNPENRLQPSDPKCHSLQPFAQEIAARLDDGRLKYQYDTLWLFVARPLLGDLKLVLSRATDRRVEIAQDVDFTALEVREIEVRLKEISQRLS